MTCEQFDGPCEACIIEKCPDVVEAEQDQADIIDKQMKLERALFELHILNNRMDDPRNGGLTRDGVTDGYIDQRIQYGWECWKAAKAA